MGWWELDLAYLVLRLLACWPAGIARIQRAAKPQGRVPKVRADPVAALESGIQHVQRGGRGVDSPPLQRLSNDSACNGIRHLSSLCRRTK